MTYTEESQASRFSQSAEGLSGSDIIKLAWEINDRKKRGENILNLTIGDFSPSYFPIPDEMAQAITRAYADRKTNYPQSEGIPELRQAVAAYLKAEGGFDVLPEEIQIAGGARPLVYAVFQTLVNPGEKVLYGVPSWNNEHFVYLREAIGIPVNSGPENHFLPTADLIEPHIRDLSLIALCSPLNPTGTVFREKELLAICKLIAAENTRRKGSKKPLYLMYDQIYWQLRYGNTPHVHPVGLMPELKPYTLYIDGISKAYAATGVRVGWAFGPVDIIEKMKHILGHVGAWAPRPEQTGVASFLTTPTAYRPYLNWINRELFERLNAFYKGFKALQEKGLPVYAIPPEAALYLSVKFPIKGKKHLGNNQALSTSQDIANYLMNYAGFAAVPFKSFGANSCPEWFRISVGTCSLADIDEVLQRLEKALNELS